MKSTERQHLKENELAHLAAAAGDLVQERGKPILTAVVAIVVVVAAVGGYIGWKNSVESNAHAKLAAALAIEEARVGPPAAFGTQPQSGPSYVSVREKNQALMGKLKEVADAYPSSDAGLYARYRQGSTAMALGDPKGAAAAFQQVISQGGDGVYAQMARLALAEAQAQTGEYDAAIATFRDLSQRKDGQLPVDGLLIRLGRVQLDAGKTSEAEQTFNKLVQEFPDSPFTADARKELEQLKKAS
ncbi:MAG: tetratricopeptide repeat protein [Acidobacteria bacterium]|nr:tetratricopeptide repeat protein [Acidobacteriota bacterium]